MSPPRRAGSLPRLLFGFTALALAIDLEQLQTGPVAQTLSASLPVEIGESSSTELPIGEPPEQPPVSGMPQLQKLRRGASDQ